jgi:hypothetical protein
MVGFRTDAEGYYDTSDEYGRGDEPDTVKDDEGDLRVILLATMRIMKAVCRMAKRGLIRGLKG